MRARTLPPTNQPRTDTTRERERRRERERQAWRQKTDTHITHTHTFGSFSQHTHTHIHTQAPTADDLANFVKRLSKEERNLFLGDAARKSPTDDGIRTIPHLASAGCLDDQAISASFNSFNDMQRGQGSGSKSARVPLALLNPAPHLNKRLNVQCSNVTTPSRALQSPFCQAASPSPGLFTPRDLSTSPMVYQEQGDRQTPVHKHTARDLLEEIGSTESKPKRLPHTVASSSSAGIDGNSERNGAGSPGRHELLLQIDRLRYHLSKSQLTCTRLAAEKCQVVANLDSLWSQIHDHRPERIKANRFGNSLSMNPNPKGGVRALPPSSSSTTSPSCARGSGSSVGFGCDDVVVSSHEDATQTLALRLKEALHERDALRHVYEA